MTIRKQGNVSFSHPEIEFVPRTLLCTLVYGVMEEPHMQRTYFSDAAHTLAMGERDLHPGSIKRTRSRAHADSEGTCQRTIVPARTVRPAGERDKASTHGSGQASRIPLPCTGAT
jgi:hypothetical protein